jgi:hypothetical protein
MRGAVCRCQQRGGDWPGGSYLVEEMVAKDLVDEDQMRSAILANTSDLVAASMAARR